MVGRIKYGSAVHEPTLGSAESLAAARTQGWIALPCCRAAVRAGTIFANDMDCVFCQIAAGVRPAEVVHESRTTIAFLDRHPAARGHTLLVPRQHVATLAQLPDGAAGSFFASLMEVIESLTETLRPAALEISWIEGVADEQHASHVHARLVPCFRDELSETQALGERGDRKHRAEIAAVIRRGGRRRETPGVMMLSFHE